MSQVDPLHQKAYWEEAGERGYHNHMFNSGEVERHLIERQWALALKFGLQLGLNRESRILDLGCGDGSFANRILAHNFGSIYGCDFAEAGIRRARAEASKPEMQFEICDLTTADLRTLPPSDGVFLIGILHHVKKIAPAVVRALRQITTRVVVLEPNGSNVIRKLLELTPSYRAAGEDSFRVREIKRMFEQAGFRLALRQRLILFPNFTPRPVFRIFKNVEPIVEQTPVFSSICAANMFGFVAAEA